MWHGPAPRACSWSGFRSRRWTASIWLSDVTRVLADHGVNILSGSQATGSDRVAISQFSFEMADPQHLNRLLAAVRKIDGVFDVYRVTGAKDSAVPRLRKMQ